MAPEAAFAELKEYLAEIEEQEDDPVALGMIVMTAVFLVAAIVINMMNLGGYGVGPFKP